MIRRVQARRWLGWAGVVSLAGAGACRRGEENAPLAPGGVRAAPLHSAVELLARAGRWTVHRADVATLVPGGLDQEDVRLWIAAAELAVDASLTWDPLPAADRARIAGQVAAQAAQESAAAGGALAWQGALALRWQTPESWQLHLRTQLAADALAGSALQAPVNAEEVARYYAKHQQLYVAPEQLRFAELAVHAETPGELAAARAALHTARERLAQGINFEEVWGELTGALTSAQGRDRGWTTPSDLDPRLAKALQSLQVGQTTPVVQTSFGLHVLRLLERIPSQPLPLPQAQQLVGEHLRAERAVALRLAKLQELREAAPMQWLSDRSAGGPGAPVPLPRAQTVAAASALAGPPWLRTRAGQLLALLVVLASACQAPIAAPAPVQLPSGEANQGPRLLPDGSAAVDSLASLADLDARLDTAAALDADADAATGLADDASAAALQQDSYAVKPDSLHEVGSETLGDAAAKSDTDAEAGATADGVADSLADTLADTKPDTAADAKLDTAADVKLDTAADAKLDTVADAKVDSGADAKVDTATDTKADSGLKEVSGDAADASDIAPADASLADLPPADGVAAPDGAVALDSDAAVDSGPAPTWATDPQKAVANLHQTWQHDPATTLTLSWTTEVSDPKTYLPQAVYAKVADAGPDGAQLLQTGKVAVGTSVTYPAVLAAGGKVKAAWHVELTGLQPDTEYIVRAGTWTAIGPSPAALVGAELSLPATFRTAPPAGSAAAMTLVFAGDSRGGLAKIQANMAYFQNIPALAWFFNGDMSPVGTQDEWNDWFTTLQPVLRRRPLMPVQGNHETLADHYYAQFALPVAPGLPPALQEHAWSLDVGNVHVIGLDANSEVMVKGQAPWLAADLQAAQSNPAIEWIVATMHQSPYSACPVHGSTAYVQKHWVPLFDKYGVDLVFSGHDHNYERTHPLAGNQVVGTSLGVTYVVAGAFFAPAYANGKQWWTAVSHPGNAGNLAIMTVQGKTLTVKVWSGDGKTQLDSFGLVH